jgi:hypothetical protein
MPYRISIPDTCDRRGCDAKEAAELIAMATDTLPEEVKLPNMLRRTEVYSSQGESSFVLAQAMWYEVEIEDKTSNS